MKIFSCIFGCIFETIKLRISYEFIETVIKKAKSDENSREKNSTEKFLAWWKTFSMVNKKRRDGAIQILYI